ncbi:MAG: hypothetical protein A3G87_03935 [Omnitrophica bacterium RIFCSPLOWO2_12_FULL_50_11]|nr:MAG: hypothetical protein A3G87_03935 [Omnitrophica bacterium RIFCSPLOWO2_12_FULL_50_11]
MDPYSISTKELLDIREKGAPKDGSPQTSDRRLYCQLQVFSGSRDPQPLAQTLEASGLESVLYTDVNDPAGIGVLFMSEDPNLFMGEIRSLLSRTPFSSLTRKPEMTMLGRTYSTGRETDLNDWLLSRPRRTAFNPDWPWAIWYPLRRKPEFELLPKEEQNKILMEHAVVGIAYGEADLAHDIRLACHGLDRNDNEFVLGLIGKELHPLSRLVQDMRKTQQTAKYIQSLGPFFVGKVCWRSPHDF